jgi:hypothetical protein
MPPRRQFSDDPYYGIYHQTAWKEDQIRPGYLEHRDIANMYEQALDLDRDERLQFWRDYNNYLVSDRNHYRRSDPGNPFWDKWGIDPDVFDWHSWREAMGYPHGGRR